MIYDFLKNSQIYFASGSKLEKALDFIKNFNLSQPDGRYEIDETMFAIAMSYQTKPAEQQKTEAHKKYIDIQAVLGGSERIDVIVVSDKLVVDTPYNETKDIMFYKAPETYVPLNMPAGTFALLYPHDIHRPCCNLDGVSTVRKIVAKVPV